MHFLSFNKFLLGAVIIAVAILLAGGIIFSTKAYAQTADVTSTSSGATECETVDSGGGDCYKCPTE